MALPTHVVTQGKWFLIFFNQCHHVLLWHQSIYFQMKNGIITITVFIADGLFDGFRDCDVLLLLVMVV